ncbi:MAG: hypothetical protein R3F23_06515 [Verrucomicrobiia bacterium]
MNFLKVGFLLTVGFLAVSLPVNAQFWQWAKTSKAAFEDPYKSMAQGKTVCVDSLGNVYVVAMWRDTVDFGFNDDPNDEESFFEPDIQSGAGAFLLKYSPQGTVLLVQKLGSVDNVNKAVLDFSGKFLYVVGSYSHSTSFAGKPINTFNNMKQTFVAKLDVSGSQAVGVWGTTIGSELKLHDSASIAVDFMGNCYLTSQFTGILNITQNFFLASDGNQTDVYVAKLNSGTGKAEWADVIRGLGEDLDNVSKDLNFSFSSGALYLVAGYKGNAVEILSAQKVIQGNKDQGYVVVKYNGTSSGNGKPTFAWATTIGSRYEAFDFETRIVSDDRAGNVAVGGGYFADTPLLFDDASVDADAANPGNQNVFLAVLSSVDGSLNWVKRGTFPVKSNRVARQQGLAVDSNGNFYLTGWVAMIGGGLNNFQFDDAPKPLGLTGFLAKIYHVKYDKDGVLQWQLLSGDGTGNEFEVFTGTQSEDICVDKSFNVYSTGSFSGGDVTFPNNLSLKLTGEDSSQQTCIWTGRLKQP